MSKSKSIATTKAIAKHVRGLVNFYIELRVETNVALTGEHSVILLRDYLESLVGRGRSVPSTPRRALTARSDALGIEWPLNNALVTSRDYG